MFGLSLNLLWKKAVTQHTGMPFNSMAVVNGQVVAGTSSGLVVCGGDDDAGTAIDASFASPVTDFGSVNNKAIRFAFLNGEVDGELTVTAKADSTERSDTVDEDGTLQGHRFVFGRDVNGRNVQVEVSNSEGSDFSVDSMEVVAVIRQQKTGRM